MILYHGSNSIVNIPEVITSEIGRDFGFGFYTTSIKAQAVRWSKRKALIARRSEQQSQPILNMYAYNEFKAASKLKIKRFNSPDLEWLEFIMKCRSDIYFRHEYDIVIGNIADDNVGETVSYVMSGIMRKEDAVERLKFEKINNQICFNTDKSLGYIKFVESQIVK